MSDAISRLLDEDDLLNEFDRDFVRDFCDLMRWLRKNGFPDYARGLNVDRVEKLPPNPTADQEAEALRSAITVVTHLFNDPPQGLKSKQAIEFKDRRRVALESARMREIRLAASLRERQRAIAEVERWQANGGQSLLELREFAAAKLKGKQRELVEVICDYGGSIPLPDLAVAMGWNRQPAGVKFNEYKKVVNPKLTKAGLPWRLKRHDNCVQVYQPTPSK
jgi:hypothetical protein